MSREEDARSNTRSLTEKQKVFVLEYARNGGNGTKAAKEAGYSTASAAELARQTLRLPHVRQAINNALARLRYESGAIGLDALKRIAQDTKVPAAAQVAAARALVEHAGMIGTAKDIEAARAAAEEAADVEETIVDFDEALAELGKAKRRQNEERQTTAGRG
jgi:phage terminase small subunit